ncbi:hypothetical protein IFM89_015225 [Coptis chinensis]|uniref:Uncharacterized protein n=1 Tax=Coptis chinensis TaxID=261450 RepID=A0A835H3G3_9MAGN|nr:hypothetical protein IFM89_015225 [Coptis chinensis]
MRRDLKILWFVVSLQVLANVASVVIGETGPFMKDWIVERDFEDGWKAARNLAKLTLFRQFYIVMIGPVERNLYFVLDEEEEEAAQQILQDEEFEL